MNRGKKTPQSFLTCSKENDGKRAVSSENSVDEIRPDILVDFVSR